MTRQLTCSCTIRHSWIQCSLNFAYVGTVGAVGTLNILIGDRTMQTPSGQARTNVRQPGRNPSTTRLRSESNQLGRVWLLALAHLFHLCAWTTVLSWYVEGYVTELLMADSNRTPIGIYCYSFIYFESFRQLSSWKSRLRKLIHLRARIGIPYALNYGLRIPSVVQFWKCSITFI
jgi:hypothetical protein